MNFDKILVHLRRTVLRKFKSLISQNGSLLQKSTVSHTSCFVERYLSIGVIRSENRKIKQFFPFEETYRQNPLHATLTSREF